MKYIHIDSFSKVTSGLTRVCNENNLWGYQDLDKYLLIKCQYEQADPFFLGYAFVCKKGFWGMLDRLGQIIIPTKYDSLAYGFKNCILANKNGKYGLFSRFGIKKVDMMYDSVQESTDGKFFIFSDQGSKFYLVDWEGNQIIAKSRYASIEEFDFNLWKVSTKKGFLGLISSEGKIVFEPKYQLFESIGKDIFTFSLKNKVGLADPTGNILIPNIYDFISPLAIVSNDFLSGITEFSQYLLAQDYEKGSALISKNNQIILPFAQQAIFAVHDNLFFVQQEKIENQQTKMFYFAVDNQGNKVSKDYDYLQAITQNVFVFAENELKGLLNENFEVLLEPTYESINLGEEYTLEQVPDHCYLIYNFNGNNFYGLYDLKNKEVAFPADHQELFWQQEAKCFITRKNDKTGLLDLNKKIVVDLVYDSIFDFNGKNFCATLNGKHGSMSAQGELIIPCQYDLIDNSDPEKTKAFLVSMIDKKGNVLANPNFKVAFTNIETNPESSLSVVQDNQSLLYGFINQNWELLVPCEFDLAENLADGRALVYKNAFYGYLNSKADQSIEFQYENASNFVNGLAVVTDSNQKQGIINRRNEKILPLEYDELLLDKESDWIRTFISEQGYGMINSRTMKFIPEKYEYLEIFKDGLALFIQSEKYGFIDENQQIIIEAKFDYASSFQDGFSVFAKSVATIPDSATENETKWGVMNSKGKTIVPAIYDGIFYVGYGHFAATNTTTQNMCLLNNKGVAILENQASISLLGNQLLTLLDLDYQTQFFNLKTKKMLDLKNIYEDGEVAGMIKIRNAENKCGFMNLQGKIVIDCIYDDAKEFSEGLVAVCLNEKWGFIDQKGKKVIGFDFDDVEKFAYSRALVYKTALIK